jgi:hypothetical protein
MKIAPTRRIFPVCGDDRDFSLGVFPPDLQETPAGKPRRSRLLVFCCLCLPVLVLGLAYTVMQPAEYQATARLEITPASAAPVSVVEATPGAKKPGRRQPGQRSAAPSPF